MSTGDEATLFIPAGLRIPPGAGVLVGTMGPAGRRLASAGRPIGEQDAVEIGSVTKVFTGLLLATLVVDGVAGLDDQVVRLIPELRRYRSLLDVTLEDLATHGSGLPRLPIRLLARVVVHPAEPYRGLTAGRVVAAAPRYARGRQAYRYSNYGFMLLGEALSRATEMSYDEALRRRVLEPLGLASTGSGIDALPGMRRSGKHAHAWSQEAVPGAGGLRSTLADLMTLAHAVIEPPPRLREAIRLAVTPRRRLARSGLGVGLGWYTGERNGRRVVFHNGATAGGTAFVACSGRTSAAAIATVGGLGALDVVALDAITSR